MLSNWYYHTIHWLNRGWYESWRWIDSLDRQEWMVLLAVVSAAGFYCMRGYSSRMQH